MSDPEQSDRPRTIPEIRAVAEECVSAATSFEPDTPAFRRAADACAGAYLTGRLEGEAENGRLCAERDALLAACITETWRQPLRTLAGAEDSGVLEHGWEWRVAGMGGFARTREEAVAAVRRAAKLGEG